MGVSTIDDDIALFQIGFQLFNELINSVSRLYEKNDLARTLELRNQFLDTVSTLNLGAYEYDQGSVISSPREVSWK